MATIRLIISSVLLVAFMAASSEAGWLIFHEPEFNGKILDIDAKQPIEGAVVVVEYKKETLGVGAGNMSSVIAVRETLTDKDGNFHFPSYTTLIQPFSWQIPTVFVIYKPGYASVELALKDYLTGKEKREVEGSWPIPEFKGLQYRLLTETVELPKLSTREQRLMSRRIYIENYTAKELPHLYKALGEDGEALGVE
jgi:hypothetical protein